MGEERREENGMNKIDIITTIQTQLGDAVLGVRRKSDQRVYIDISPDRLIDASHLMLEQLKARLQIATGIDTSNGFEVMYHWALDTEGIVITLRVLVDHDSPELVRTWGGRPRRKTARTPASRSFSRGRQQQSGRNFFVANRPHVPDYRPPYRNPSGTARNFRPPPCSSTYARTLSTTSG